MNHLIITNKTNDFSRKYLKLTEEAITKTSVLVLVLLGKIRLVLSYGLQGFLGKGQYEDLQFSCMMYSAPQLFNNKT